MQGPGASGAPPVARRCWRPARRPPGGRRAGPTACASGRHRPASPRLPSPSFAVSRPACLPSSRGPDGAEEATRRSHRRRRAHMQRCPRCTRTKRVRGAFRRRRALRRRTSHSGAVRRGRSPGLPRASARSVRGCPVDAPRAENTCPDGSPRRRPGRCLRRTAACRRASRRESPRATRRRSAHRRRARKRSVPETCRRGSPSRPCAPWRPGRRRTSTSRCRNRSP